ncbi:laforin-like [Meleagris gallopavo]|uniref:laforin-like n=1 Tax=Meleagris gallopavo TaxID=9103 RepID=UPI000549BE30|nr:laforin-like [Meleagris gallopavo]
MRGEGKRSANRHGGGVRRSVILSRHSRQMPSEPFELAALTSARCRGAARSRASSGARGRGPPQSLLSSAGGGWDSRGASRRSSAAGAGARAGASAGCRETARIKDQPDPVNGSGGGARAAAEPLVGPTRRAFGVPGKRSVLGICAVPLLGYLNFLGSPRCRCRALAQLFRRIGTGPPRSSRRVSRALQHVPHPAVAASRTGPTDRSARRPRRGTREEAERSELRPGANGGAERSRAANAENVPRASLTEWDEKVGRERREVCGVWQRAVKTIGDRERLLSEERMRDQRLPSVLPEYDDLWRALLNPTGLVLILLQGEGSSEAFFC